MAEIHVEPRRRSKAWLWLLLLVLVLVVVGWIIFGSGTVQIGALRTTHAGSLTSTVAAVRAVLPAGGSHG